MSTKLNAEELAAKRYEQEGAYYDPEDVYAAAIREVAQPIADERDKAIEERDELRKALENILDSIDEETPLHYNSSVIERAFDLIAKYPKP